MRRLTHEGLSLGDLGDPRGLPRGGTHGAGHYEWLCRSDRAPSRQCFLRSRQDNDSGCAAVAAHVGPWPAGGKMRSRREQSVAKPALMSGTIRRRRGGRHYSASQRLANPSRSRAYIWSSSPSSAASAFTSSASAISIIRLPRGGTRAGLAPAARQGQGIEALMRS